MSALEVIGLRVNLGKCTLWGPGATSIADQVGIAETAWGPGSGLTVLGIPVDYPGSSKATEQAWEEKVLALEKASQLVVASQRAQIAHHLLRHCVDGCRLTHLLRGPRPTRWTTGWSGGRRPS